MKASIARAFERLPGLGHRTRLSEAACCKLCGGPAPFFDVVDFNKYCSRDDPYEFGASGINVPYLRCTSCGFLFTTFFDTWSSAEFGRFIYNADYIKVDGEYESVRPAQYASQIGRVLTGCKHRRILDYGSGSGAFARQLASHGFACIESYDPFSNPVRPVGRFDVVTCFEVIEHSPDPVALLADIRTFMADDALVIFSQALQPGNIERIRGAWWYLAPRNGHISMYSSNALCVLAATAGLAFHGRDTPYCLATHSPGQFAASLLPSFGPKHAFIQLFAPERLEEMPSDGGPRVAGWHGLEGEGNLRYRWTSTERVDWTVSPLPLGTLLSVEIPFVNVIERSYLENIQVQCGSSTAKATAQGHKLCAEVVVGDAFSNIVTLITPPTRSPAEMRNVRDNRRLGLAVNACPTHQRQRWVNSAAV